MKRIIFYTTIAGKCYIADWLNGLDNSISYKVQIRLERVKQGNFGDAKSLGGGLYELRFKNGTRIYYTEAEGVVVILFNGGDKSSQRRDITRAKELLQEFKTR